MKLTMKKRLLLALVIIFIISFFAGCHFYDYDDEEEELDPWDIVDEEKDYNSIKDKSITFKLVSIRNILMPEANLDGYFVQRSNMFSNFSAGSISGDYSENLSYLCLYCTNDDDGNPTRRMQWTKFDCFDSDVYLIFMTPDELLTEFPRIEKTYQTIDVIITYANGKTKTQTEIYTEYEWEIYVPESDTLDYVITMKFNEED